MTYASAIPTVYNGVQFRSRIEARWAAMFDLLEWPWEFEPVDLDGYIPDFLLRFQRPLLVEVKFLVGDLHTWQADPAVTKIIKSGWSDDFVLLGAGLSTGMDGDAVDNINVYLGRYYDRCAGELYWNPFGVKDCPRPYPHGLVDVIGDYRCRGCGWFTGNQDLVDGSLVQSLWKKAGNLVQWKGAANPTFTGLR